MKRDPVLHVALPVLIGGTMYLAFRSTDHLLFRWADALALGGFVAWLRESFSALRGAGSWGPASGWLFYSLPDALWLYGFAYWMAVTWRGAGLEARLWRWLPLGLALGSEAAQGLDLLQGTFDPGDVVGYLAAFAFASLAAMPRAQRRTEATA